MNLSHTKRQIWFEVLNRCWNGCAKVIDITLAQYRGEPTDCWSLLWRQHYEVMGLVWLEQTQIWRDKQLIQIFISKSEARIGTKHGMNIILNTIRQGENEIFV